MLAEGRFAAASDFRAAEFGDDDHQSLMAVRRKIVGGEVGAETAQASEIGRVPVSGSVTMVDAGQRAPSLNDGRVN